MSEPFSIPKQMIRRMIRLSAELEKLQDEIDDVLMANNPQLLDELRRSRQDELAGKTRPYEALARNLGLRR